MVVEKKTSFDFIGTKDLTVVADQINKDLDLFESFKKETPKLWLKVCDQRRKHLTRMARFFERIDEGLPSDFSVLFNQQTEGYPLSLHALAEARFTSMQDAFTQLIKKRNPE